MSKRNQHDDDIWKVSSHYCTVDNEVARKIGLNEAIVLRTIYTLCLSKKANKGVEWWKGTRQYWLIKFPWMSENTLKRVLSKLIKAELLDVRIDTKTGNSYRPNEFHIRKMLADDEYQLAQSEPNESGQFEPELAQSGPESGQSEPTLLSLGSSSLSSSLSSGCGEPILATAEAAAPQEVIEPEVLIDEPKAKAQKPAGSLIFEAYREAYLRRYNVEPLRNAKTNGICSQIAKQLPLDEAIALMHFFLQQNVAFYIQRGHAIQLALGDLQALRTNMLNNQAMSSRQAQLADKQQAQKNALQNYLENREKYALK